MRLRLLTTSQPCCEKGYLHVCSYHFAQQAQDKLKPVCERGRETEQVAAGARGWGGEPCCYTAIAKGQRLLPQGQKPEHMARAGGQWQKPHNQALEVLPLKPASQPPKPHCPFPLPPRWGKNSPCSCSIVSCLSPEMVQGEASRSKREGERGTHICLPHHCPGGCGGCRKSLWEALPSRLPHKAAGSFTEQLLAWSKR